MNQQSLTVWQTLLLHLKYLTVDQWQQQMVFYQQILAQHPQLGLEQFFLHYKILTPEQLEQAQILLRDGYYHCQPCGQIFPVPAGQTGARGCPRCNHPLDLHPQPNANTPLTEEVMAKDTFPQFAQEEPEKVTLLESNAAPQYPVHRLLGEGGYGQVYQVEDRLSGRKMALKVLRGKAARDWKVKRRFLREIQITSRLEHPHIMPVYGSGYLSNGSLYFVMQELKGGDFKDFLQETDEENWLRESLDIFLKVCQAMEYSHSQQVVHRDLKPSNIAVGKFGEVMVLDWGIAKCVDIDEPEEMESESALEDIMGEPTLTQGGIMGTPGYLSPEQARGEEVDWRCDVFSLGAVLYEILTGRAPYEGSARQRLTEVLLKSPVPPHETERGDAIPVELSAVAMKALERDKADRYQSVAEMRRDINRFLEGYSVSARQDSLWEMGWKWIRRNKALSGGLAVAVMAVVISLLIASYLENSRREGLIASYLQSATTLAKNKSHWSAQQLKTRYPNSYKAGAEEEIEAKQKREISLQHYMKWRRFLAKAHELDTERKDIGTQLAKVEEEIGQLALLGGELPFSQASFERVKAFNLARGKELLQQVSIHQTATAKAHLTRINNIVIRISQSPPHPGMIEEYGNELVRMRGQHVVKAMISQLNHSQKWPRLLAIETLGKINDNLGKYQGKKVGTHLMEKLEKLDPKTNREEAIALIWALGRLKYAPAAQLVSDIRQSFGTSSPVFYKTILPQMWIPMIEKNGKTKTAQDWVRSGLIWQNKQNWTKTLEHYNRAIKLDPKLAEAYLRRGRAYRRLNRFKDALKDLNLALQLKPNWEEALYQRGITRLRSGKYSTALQDINKVIAMDPNNHAYYGYRGRAYFQMNKLSLALADFKKARQMSPNYEDSYLNPGVLYISTNQLDKAIKIFTEGIQKVDRPVGLYEYRSLAYRRQGKLRLALADCNQAIRINPRRGQYYMRRGLIYLKLGQYKLGIKDLDFAAKKDPYNLPMMSKICTYFLQTGLQFHRRKDSRRAIAYYQQSIKFYSMLLKTRPKYIRGYEGRAQAYFAMRKNNLACQDLTTVLKIMPNHPSRQRYRGLIRRYSGK